jgi:segregation and condensation protein B
MKDRLEAILFAAGRYVDEEQMAKLLAEDIRRVRKALQELKTEYETRADTSLQVVQEEKSWKMHVKDTYLDLVSKLVSDKEIATTVLETLAIIAWKTPAMQAYVIKVRGPAAYDHINELIERGFVTKEPEGRTFKLRITDKFFEYFDIEGKENLHKLFQAVGEEAARKQAEVDKQEADYQAKKQAADAAAAAIAAGGTPPAQPPKLENTQLAGSEHSAQNDVADLITQAAKELDESASPPQENPAKSTVDLLSEIKDDVKELGQDIEKLKQPIQSNEMPIRKPAPRKKH